MNIAELENENAMWDEITDTLNGTKGASFTTDKLRAILKSCNLPKKSKDMVFDAKAVKAIAIVAKYFVGTLSQSAFEQNILQSGTKLNGERCLGYDDVSAISWKDPRLDSIKYAVPKRVSFEEALKLRKKKVKHLVQFEPDSVEPDSVDDFYSFDADLNENKAEVKVENLPNKEIKKVLKVSIEKLSPEKIAEVSRTEGVEVPNHVRRSLETMCLNSPMRSSKSSEPKGRKSQSKITSFFAKSQKATSTSEMETDDDISCKEEPGQ